jgi:hypothetical protein
MLRVRDVKWEVEMPKLRDDAIRKMRERLQCRCEI